MPFALAATCARKSETTSVRFRHAASLECGLSAGGFACFGASRSDTMPASSKVPPLTRKKASITAPSSDSVVESAGIDPGVDPPTSAWWPRDAQ